MRKERTAGAEGIIISEFGVIVRWSLLGSLIAIVNRVKRIRGSKN